MDHMCTISFHMYSFPAFPRPIHLLYTDRSQAMITWLSWQLDYVLHDIWWIKEQAHSLIHLVHNLVHKSVTASCFSWLVNNTAGPMKHKNAAMPFLFFHFFFIKTVLFLRAVCRLNTDSLKLTDYTALNHHCNWPNQELIAEQLHSLVTESTI